MRYAQTSPDIYINNNKKKKVKRAPFSHVLRQGNFVAANLAKQSNESISGFDIQCFNLSVFIFLVTERIIYKAAL